MKMPVVFAGHGDPMIALRNDDMTRGLSEIGEKILDTYGKPKAILAISAHWYTRGTFIQTADEPRQIYDMYGFPPELYEVSYPVRGDHELSDRVMTLLGDKVSANNDWGIDHGTWTVLVHMFSKADIPVVQLSVDATISPTEMLDIGKKLAALREEGYLILASGNIVHNLRMVQWDNPSGSEQANTFNKAVIDLVQANEQVLLANYQELNHAAYAVPTPDHFLPLLYAIGATDGDQVEIFNNASMMGAITMTGFLWRS